MINEETVFIIGAGGSAPYGFPTGKELSQLITSYFPDAYRRLARNNYITNRAKIEETDKQLNAFINIYNSPDPTSIDIFISRNEEFAEIGKEAIICCILKKENENRGVKHVKKQMGHWYKYLFDRMTEDLITRESGFTITNNKSVFITFNYDRSLEHYFTTRLSSHFFKGGEEHISIMKDMLFFHVHGKAGEFQWENSQPHQYGHMADFSKTQELASKLKIVYDKSEVDKDVQKEISSAKRIFFLGFGFASENLRKIGIPNILQKGQKIIGTGLELTKHEIELVKYRLQGKWVTNWQEDMIIEDADCLQLLRNHL